MNPVAEEIESYLGSASMIYEEYLEHYGMPRRSGRYPWGSGEDPYQSSRDFLGRVEQMRNLVLPILMKTVRNGPVTMQLQNLLVTTLLISELYMLSQRMNVEQIWSLPPNVSETKKE